MSSSTFLKRKIWEHFNENNFSLYYKIITLGFFNTLSFRYDIPFQKNKHCRV